MSMAFFWAPKCKSDFGISDWAQCTLLFRPTLNFLIMVNANKLRGNYNNNVLKCNISKKNFLNSVILKNIN